MAMIALGVSPVVASAHWPDTSITSGPSGLTADASPTFTFTASRSSSFQCRLDAPHPWGVPGSLVPSPWTACSSPQSYEGLADGPHSFEVRARSWWHGFADPSPARASFEVDTEAPETTIVAGPAGPIATSAVAFDFTATEPGSFECRLDSTADADWTACAAPQLYAGLADGAHDFEVRAADALGNVDGSPAIATFSIDTQPPETTIASGPSGPIATSAVAFDFTATEPGSLECRLDSADDADWAPCAPTQSYADLAEGEHRFEVRSVDGLGNTDPTPAVTTFSIDTQPPETTIDSGPSGRLESAAATFTFAATEPGSFQCRLDSAAEAGWRDCTSPKTFGSLADGGHSFEVRGVDELGNVDPSPASTAFSVDTRRAEPAFAAGAAVGPPDPTAGKTFNLELVDGNVELKCPGEDAFSKLDSFKQIPLGCLVNTRHGTVSLTASQGESGDTQSARFWGGVFVVTQEAGDDREVELKLAGRRMCERRRSTTGLVRQRGGTGGGRKLWGSGKGNFQTTGSYGSATVRGTTWLVVDRCDRSTLFKVGEGTVWVRDFVKERSLVLTTGQQYLAKATIPRLQLEP